MKQTLNAFFRQLLFWILYFNLIRLAFLLFNIRLLIAEKIPVTEVAGVFYHSVKLDLATACYLMVIPFLVLVIQSVYWTRLLYVFNRIYGIIVILFYTLISTAEMGLYPEWKTKLNFKVVKYLSNPSEIYNSSETLTFFFLIILFFLLSSIAIFAWMRWATPQHRVVHRRWIFSLFFLLFTPGCLVFGMRGGLQAIPINQSESYYSGYNILNATSVNNLFNLYISIYENLQNFNRNPYIFMPSGEAASVVRNLYAVQADTTTPVLTISRPNIVLIMLESWSADLIEQLGGKPGITPEFQKLTEDGILFTSVYASGARSEQGMASVLGGFPAHPISCLTVQPDKYRKVNSLTRSLESAGYSTAFYFGGQLIYGNIKGYIYYNGFDKIMEVSDFPPELPQGKLGIHDEFTLTYMLEDLEEISPPFFAMLFTLSTHSPWDQPFPKPLTWGDNEREYINAAYYTDHCLGEFFREARTKPWYDSTLFILVADHSHNSYYNWHPHSKEYHKIPLLLFGNVIREPFRGTQWTKTGNQHDIAATLLTQLELPAGGFPWSKNLFNPFTRDFAYFSNENGAGWISPNGYFSFDLNLDYAYFFETTPETVDSMNKEGKAYLQEVFLQYLED